MLYFNNKNTDYVLLLSLMITQFNKVILVPHIKSWMFLSNRRYTMENNKMYRNFTGVTFLLYL